MSDPFADDIIAFLPNLRRFALSLCRSADIADDLVQITVERAFASRAQFDPDTRLDAWLLRILRNAWIDMTRRDKTRGTQINIDDVPEASVVDGSRVAETAIMLKAAQSAIATLPENQRDVILLICVEELSYKEAAEVLGTPIGTVMSRLARARIALAEKLGINREAARSSDSRGGI
ncbi:RNA polymerase sigma factor [Aestuariivita sp.]|jgi:RNA polymerase sigma-70 factor (ECF subfamily)|uniref:RNA polymerase sigma factor n=1 Tax=Aestuariivita sp. TaxID=1872407 RepID=UPI00216C2973|nr:RNA polymerase sigma factor [Aestuariivita sp.]MCE8008444.1 RNA polymerase sigma factor [Aestuariivita sp.]